ncbi:MAG: hypothetical protein LUC33_01635, partial [Prevotellaceae bacterium]|nr:hypothetical protein [Prevotellaceae bacterium]
LCGRLDQTEFKIATARKAAPLGEIIESAADDVSEAHNETADILCALADDAARSKELRERAVDWEQRRYEIARELFARHLAADKAVEYADILVRKLREEGAPCN